MTEGRQFVILVRTSVGRLMDTAVASRGIDATQFAIWSFALIATPPFVFALRSMRKYAFLFRQSDGIEATVLADRLFFIVYVMLAAALVAAVLWDALFPDRQDQEIIGVLPVRPRTVAAARLTAALGAGSLFSAGLGASSGFLYAQDVAMGFRSAAAIGSGPAVFVGHTVAVTLAGIFTFAALLALRGIAVACVGADVAQRAAAVLQLVAIVLLVEAVIFLPGLLETLVRELADNRSASLLPPIWFMGLYAAIGGPPAVRASGLVTLAIGATGAALMCAAAVYVLPAAWNARRTVEAKLRTRAGRSVALAQRLASPVLRQPAARAVFAFTLASLTRSRRHALTVATYAAAGIALGAVRYAAAYVREVGIPLDAPADYLLALPLVMTFFLVAALRSAFSVPTDVGGNWIFRVAHPPSAAVCVHALGVAVIVVAVLPVTLVWLLVTAVVWSPWQAAAAAVMHAASGIALVELTLIGCRSIPFTRAHVAAVNTLRVRWLAGATALHLFAFRLDDLQLAAMRSTGGVLLYVLAMGAVVALARAYRRARLLEETLEFEAPSEAHAVLNLSQATG